MIYFRDHARELGCDVDNLGDLDVWRFIMMHQGRVL